ncbi:MAG: hypothetical protein HY647_13595 [Acidobacteria bacterium]|nr:hypothetical protein [Acidobacteriota bacterium]
METLVQNTSQGVSSMDSMYYIGLDVHKKTIRYCVKDVSSRAHGESMILATWVCLDRWMKTLPQPWTTALAATMFTGWIYEYLMPHADGKIDKETLAIKPGQMKLNFGLLIQLD